jgi:hypothetical protein
MVESRVKIFPSTGNHAHLEICLDVLRKHVRASGSEYFANDLAI